jgi:hypothetical protein
MLRPSGEEGDEVEMRLGPMLSIGRDDARQRAGHHILGIVVFRLD